MKIKLSNSNQDFINDYSEWLNENEVELQLFFRNLINLEQDLSNGLIRGGVFDDNDELLLLFLNATPWNLQIASFVDDSYEACDYLAKYIYENKIDINGCQGDLFDCQQFITAYNIWTGKLIKINLSMDILRLTRVLDIPSIGKLIRPNESYREKIREGLFYFYLEALHFEVDETTLDIQTDMQISNPNFYLYINNDNQIVSYIKCHKCLPHGSIINFVFTYKEFRHQNYAKAMVADLSRELLKSNEYVTLFVDKNNPISNKVYEDVGFEFIIDNFDCKVINDKNE